MPKTRFRPEEMVITLRHAAVLLGPGKKVAAVVKAGRVGDGRDDQNSVRRPGNTLAGGRTFAQLECRGAGTHIVRMGRNGRMC